MIGGKLFPEFWSRVPFSSKCMFTNKQYANIEPDGAADRMAMMFESTEQPDHGSDAKTVLDFKISNSSKTDFVSNKLLIKNVLLC